jgi:hypothetical protein
MQIHEITRSLTEGILGDIGRGVLQGATGIEIPQSQASINKSAASSAAKLQAQGYGSAGTTPPGKPSPIPSAEWKDKLDQTKKDPAVAQYLGGLIKGWEARQKQLQPEPAKAQAQTPPVQSKQAQAQKQAQKQSSPSSVQSIKLGGQLLTKGDDNLWYSEDGRAVTDPAQAAKIDRAYQGQEYRKKQFQQTAMVKEAPENSQANPGPSSDTMKAEFIEWTDENLASRDSYYNNITMKDVRANVKGIAAVLDQKLDAVVAQKYAPAAVKDYLQTAIAGVQARSQQLKNQEPQTNLASRTGARAKLGDVQQTLAQVGVNPQALSAFGNKVKSKNVRATGNAEADALLTQAGFAL